MTRDIEHIKPRTLIEKDNWELLTGDETVAHQQKDMKMTEPHKHADVLIAIAEGKQVQYMSPSVHKWVTSPPHTSGNPINFPEYEWRIKPELITVWINVYPDYFHIVRYENKEEADKVASPYRIACTKLTYTPGEGL